MMDWNWPSFPRRVAYFIATGQVPHSMRVTMEVDTPLASTWGIYDDNEPLAWWERFLVAGCLLALVTCAVLVVWGLFW